MTTLGSLSEDQSLRVVFQWISKGFPRISKALGGPWNLLLDDLGATSGALLDDFWVTLGSLLDDFRMTFG